MITLKKKKVFHTLKVVDYSHLSSKDQALRMAKDYAVTPTANKHLAECMKKWANDLK